MSSYQEFDTIHHRLLSSEINPEEKKRIYSSWADKYDLDMSTHWEFRRGQAMVAQAQMDVLGERKNAKILDLGAGTGRCGEELRKHGYQNIDALDASREMLDQAEEKRIYSKLICDQLGANKLDIPDGAYDGIVSFGLFVPNHANDTAFEEIIRIMSPGAYFTFIISESYFDCEEFKRFEPRIEELAIRGLWKVQSRDRREYQRKLHEENGVSGIMFTIQKL